MSAEESAQHYPLTMKIDETVCMGIFNPEIPVQEGRDWELMVFNNARFAQNVLLRAQQLRDCRTDPGKAYIRGLTDMLLALSGQAILELCSDFNPDEEIKKLDNTV